MQTFQVTSNPPPGPKNYVFVDEHNRHKRLKVMRACEGCRRRKIKCDAATTNTWPCAACKRLKLPCVPPAGGLEYDQQTSDTETSISQQPTKAVTQPVSIQYDPYTQYQAPPVQNITNFPHDGAHPPNQTYLQEAYHYVPQHQLPSSNHAENGYSQRYPSLDTSSVNSVNNLSQHSRASPRTPDHQTADNLAEHLGELRIGENGVAPYLRQQKMAGMEADGPIQESEISLPPLSTAAGSQIRIPPALMPGDRDASEAFQVFFEHVHPYVPVLSRSQFHHQWQTDRQGMSPLLLETVFACAGRVSGEPVEESPWLALANKHEGSFLDTPRLSTVQALLLLLKAREGSPKRGYFYRSWMTTKTIVSMAKDLDLHEHYAVHKAGESCESNAADCISKTRAWQAIMICEFMIGAPQGRFDFGVDGSTVEFDPNPVNADIDDYEAKISHQFAYYARNVRNIRSCVVEGYLKVKRKKEWALDPIFDELQAKFHRWPEELPQDLQLSLPSDGTLPHLPSHFIGNMHSHYQLGIIMLHRPQIVALAKQSMVANEQWRLHMAMSYAAAKRLCQIQEALIAQYDMTGLLCMQRGMSYTIYAILTCIMLHLVAITSPDPEFNSDAREYFVRHMRILERCMPEWPMHETDRQINNLRAAFSADLEQPFELKPSFPYGSPSSTSSTVRRASGSQGEYLTPPDHTFYQQQQQYSQAQQTYFPTPPTSAVTTESKSHSPQYYPSYGVSEQSQHPQYRGMAPTSYPQQNMGPNTGWNPGPLIDQFNTAFAIPPSQLQPPPSSGYGSSPPIPAHPSLPPQHFTPSPQTPTYDLNAFARHQAQAQAQAQAQSAQIQQPPQSQPLTSHQQTPAYFDPNSHPNTSHPMPMAQPYPSEGHNLHDPSPGTPQPSGQAQGHMPGMVYVSAKEWQQSVASVFDPGGLKRRWTFDMSAA